MTVCPGLKMLYLSFNYAVKFGGDLGREGRGTSRSLNAARDLYCCTLASRVKASPR